MATVSQKNIEPKKNSPVALKPANGPTDTSKSSKTIGDSSKLKKGASPPSKVSDQAAKGPRDNFKRTNSSDSSGSLKLNRSPSAKSITVNSKTPPKSPSAKTPPSPGTAKTKINTSEEGGDGDFPTMESENGQVQAATSNPPIIPNGEISGSGFDIIKNQELTSGEMDELIESMQSTVIVMNGITPLEAIEKIEGTKNGVNKVNEEETTEEVQTPDPKNSSSPELTYHSLSSTNTSTPSASDESCIENTVVVTCDMEPGGYEKLTNVSATVATSQEEKEPSEVTKHSIRTKTWNHLEKNELVLFPRPCIGRIPNFKGAHQAAEKLASMDIFKNSKTVKVNPDKAQEGVRFEVLEHGKRLLVPIPRLREGLFQAVIPPAEANKYLLRSICQQYGMAKFGRPIGLEDNSIHIDLIVLGSVAVDRKGHRIGKGEGYADIEFAAMVKMNAVDESTIIATTVHDDQVMDELPENLFKDHDIPVDWIITPSEVIEVQSKLSRPKGIMWEILSNRRLMEMPILQQIRERELAEGNDCVLKETDSDVEDESPRPVVRQNFNRRRFNNNYSRSTGDPLRDNRMHPRFQMQSPRPRYYQSSYGPRNNNYAMYPQQQYRRGPPRSYHQMGGGGNDIHQYRSQSYNNSQYNRQGPRRSRSIQQQQQNRYHSYESRDGSSSQNRRRRISSRRPTESDHRSQSPDNRQRQRSSPKDSSSAESKTNKKFKSTKSRNKPQIAFSLRVKNIAPGVTIRDLKDALNERGIKPRDITWKGYKGMAFLHFVKFPPSITSTTVEDVVGLLQGITLKPRPVENLQERFLIIEPSQPRLAAAVKDGEPQT